MGHPPQPPAAAQIWPRHPAALLTQGLNQPRSGDHAMEQEVLSADGHRNRAGWGLSQALRTCASSHPTLAHPHKPCTYSRVPGNTQQTLFSFAFPTQATEVICMTQLNNHQEPSCCSLTSSSRTTASGTEAFASGPGPSEHP